MGVTRVALGLRIMKVGRVMKVGRGAPRPPKGCTNNIKSSDTSAST
jgi:hypothetical protein